MSELLESHLVLWRHSTLLFLQARSQVEVPRRAWHLQLMVWWGQN